LGCQAKPDQQTTGRTMAEIQRGLVELLQAGKQTLANPTAGRTDTPPHAQMFLATLAQQEGLAQRPAQAGGKASPPKSGEQLTRRRMADSKQSSSTHRPKQRHFKTLWIICTIGTLDSVSVGFNRRMRKTACPVVRAQSRHPAPIRSKLNGIGFKPRPGWR
jgi:hypothetical protein